MRDPRVIGLGLAGLAEDHAKPARRTLDHAKHQPLRLLMQQRLLATATGLLCALSASGVLAMHSEQIC